MSIAKVFLKLINEIHAKVAITIDMKTTVEDPIQTEKRRSTSVGTTLDGSAMDHYTLQDEGIEATVIPYGARLVSIRTPDRHGRMANVILSYPNGNDYAADRSSYLGAIVGRYANRIAAGKFSIDGCSYQATTNNGDNTLHGGTAGFDERMWAAHSFASGVELTLVSEDGDQGFPGNLAVRVRYSVSANALRIDYFFATDKTTIVNLTNHAYFNLSGHHDATILEDELTIAADWFTPIDSSLIPTGTLSSVEGTPFDFRSRTVIGARINDDHEQLKLAGGYDHNFVLNGASGDLRAAAQLYNPASGRTLTVSTTEPGLQFYTGNFLAGKPYGNTKKGHGRRTGLCLETQHFPDSPNHAHFPPTELRPGQIGRSTTIFKFSVDTP